MNFTFEKTSSEPNDTTILFNKKACGSIVNFDDEFRIYLAVKKCPKFYKINKTLPWQNVKLKNRFASEVDAQNWILENAIVSKFDLYFCEE